MKEIYRLLISLGAAFFVGMIMFGVSFGQCFETTNDSVCKTTEWLALILPLFVFCLTFFILRQKALRHPQQSSIVDATTLPQTESTDYSLVFIIGAYMCVFVPLLGFLAYIPGIIFGYFGFRRSKNSTGRVFAATAIVLLLIKLIAPYVARIN